MNLTDKAIITIETMSNTIAGLRTQLAAVQAERDALAKALDNVCGAGTFHAAYMIARAALAERTEGGA